MTSYAEERSGPAGRVPRPAGRDGRGRIPRGDVTLWTGEGSAGKGTTLVWMAVATALQGHHGCSALVVPGG